MTNYSCGKYALLQSLITGELTVLAPMTHGPINIRVNAIERESGGGKCFNIKTDTGTILFVRTTD